MFSYLIILLSCFMITEGKHFDGGTIGWAPIDPYDNSSSVGITIRQSYSWAYPTITCATNVPTSTSGRSTQNWNLTCVVDCTSDGGYSTKPIDILTDCTSSSSSLGMMSSSRSHNLTLNAGAHFYLANVGSAWVALNDPAQSGLEWSIVTFIDLRMRPDGFINTPPVASVVSPQYAIVNQTIQINIPVSDVNTGDDVRCRWSTYTAGYRRRKRSNEEERPTYISTIQLHKKEAEVGDIVHIRKKRACPASSCHGWCPFGCQCSCSTCNSTLCTGSSCSITAGCAEVPGWATTIATTVNDNTTTTIDTPGTLKSTSSYPYQQAIDECGGICYPDSLPNGTTLSNCTITFTGLKAGTWYAAAIQVEDFINETSNMSMSSVPVQFLIYVQPQPSCSNKPVFYPLTRCLEVQVGATVSFNLSALNLCNPSVATLSAIVVSSGIAGMTNGNLIFSTANSLVAYVEFTWTPQATQVGPQQLCTVAYTSEKLQSDPYCVAFTVKNSSNVCATTTKTTTSITATTATSVTTTTATTTQAGKNPMNWLLVLGLSLLALLLALCCACCCLYWFVWGLAARRRRQRKTEKDAIGQRDLLPRNIGYLSRKQQDTDRIYQPRTPNRNRRVHNVLSARDPVVSRSLSNMRLSLADSLPTMAHVEENRVPSTVSVRKLRRTSIANVNKMEDPSGTKSAPIKSVNVDNNDDKKSATPRSAFTVIRGNKVSNMNETDKNNPTTTAQKIPNSARTIQNKTAQVIVTKIPRIKSTKNQPFRADSVNVIHVNRSSIEMQPIASRSKTAMNATDRKANTSNGVTVTKVPRKSVTSEASHT